jgi:hypothetical protein
MIRILLDFECVVLICIQVRASTAMLASRQFHRLQPAYTLTCGAHNVSMITLGQLSCFHFASEGASHAPPYVEAASNQRHLACLGPQTPSSRSPCSIRRLWLGFCACGHERQGGQWRRLPRPGGRSGHRSRHLIPLGHNPDQARS